MRTVPDGFRRNSLWGHETLYWVTENTKLGVRDACGRSHWRLRWSFLWGHETLYWAGENAKLDVRDACGRPNWPRNA
eukprot:699621-Pyramimonas_sp.AAC.1